ncbi:MAG TPA: hypothetical protein VEW46_10875, partial [Pyrinomonadaceae bacterium]|nr:hypothetical protein [Pyrinomonadaceae bacterium]
VAYTSDSTTLAVRDERKIVLLDAETHKPRGYPPVGLPGNTSEVAISPDGAMLVTATGIYAVLWNVSTGKRIGQPMKHDKAIKALAFSPDGKLLTTISKGGTVKLWDTYSQKLLSTLRDESSELEDPNKPQFHLLQVAFSPDGKLLALVYANAVEFWDRTLQMPSRQAKISGDEQDFPVSSAFSPDGGILAIAYGNGKVVLHDVATFAVVATLKAGLVRSLAFSPSGKILATGGADGPLKLWDMTTRRELLTLRGLSSTPYTGLIVFSPDGKRVASADSRRMRVWYAPTETKSAVETKPSAAANLWKSSSDPPSLIRAATEIRSRQ